MVIKIDQDSSRLIKIRQDSSRSLTVMGLPLIGVRGNPTPAVMVQ
jgi:hypothetical protein